MTDQPQPGVPGDHQPPSPYGSQPPYSPPSPYGSPEPTTPPPYGQVVPQPAAYGYAGPAGAAVYGVDPATGVAWSDKTRTTAGLLSLLLPFFGICGVGRLYAGQVGLGLAQLLGFFVGCLLMFVIIGFVIAPAVWLWSVVDGIILLSSGGTDAYGRRLR